MTRVRLYSNNSRPIGLKAKGKISEFRGKEIVTDMFNILIGDRGHRLLPPDFQELLLRFGQDAEQRRVVCDFIAGMTDTYAVEFYSKLKSNDAQTIFKPI